VEEYIPVGADVGDWWEDYEEEDQDEWQRDLDWLPPLPGVADGAADDAGGFPAAALLPYFAVLALTAALVTGIVWRRRYLLGASKLGATKAVFTLYRRLLLLYTLRGVKPVSGETPRRFAVRADAVTGFKHHFTGMTMAHATALFETARYSPGRPAEDEIAELIRFYDSLLSYTRQKVGRYRFLRFWVAAP
jgi:hypothetical protein